MIAFVSGQLENVSGNTAVIDVNGLGFEVQVSAQTAGELASQGIDAAVKLYTYMIVREDQISLCGFLSRDELNLFKMLITVSGVGPKGALSILSAMSADELRYNIVSGDAAAISRAPGVGKKTAERVILDLRDKLKNTMDMNEGPSGEMSGSVPLQENSAEKDAVDALVSLGYARQEAARAVAQAKNDGAVGTEELLHKALALFN